MLGIRYIGSKARIINEIFEIIGLPAAGDGVFVDAFAGTGVVGAYAADLGWSVRLNDHLRSSMLVAAAELIDSASAPFEQLGGYVVALEALNATPPREGFIWKEYSPASGRFCPHTRMYFTEHNAARIDGMRAQIALWRRDGAVTPLEEQLLVADLMGAANRVANIAGTYGCYLSHWSATAKRELELVGRPLRETPVNFETYCLDVTDLPTEVADVVYYDPPYTKRQYAAYYHLQETIAFGDEPNVSGVTGLRPWEEKASAYCYKARALDALVTLIEDVKARRVFLSYSSEGHVDLEDLSTRLDPLGTLAVHDLAEVGRYRPNKVAGRGSGAVNEYLVEIHKDADVTSAAA